MRTYDPSAPQNTYSPEKDIQFLESNILELLYIIGYEESDLAVLSIDDIISSVRSTFPYTRLINTEQEESLTAAETVSNANCILLTSIARTLWYQYNMAKAAQNV